MTTCTFAGHREVYQGGVGADIDAAIEKIIDQGDDSFNFLVGGMGEFDGLCSGAVRGAKRRHPEKQITLSLVLPYLTHDLNENKEYYSLLYDEIIVPIELAGIHYKKAITARNRWLIDQSDFLIAFVMRDFGGAYSTLKYAEKKNLEIINIARKSV